MQEPDLFADTGEVPAIANRSFNDIEFWRAVSHLEFAHHRAGELLGRHEAWQRTKRREKQSRAIMTVLLLLNLSLLVALVATFSTPWELLLCFAVGINLGIQVVRIRRTWLEPLDMELDMGDEVKWRTQISLAEQDMRSARRTFERSLRGFYE